jgi:excisionase family DNA binding protein
MTKLLTISEVAELLTVSQSQVYALVKREKLSAYKIGSCLRIGEDDLQAYLKRQHMKAKIQVYQTNL